MNTLDRASRPNLSGIAWDMAPVTPDDNAPQGDALGNVGDAVFGLYVGRAGYVHLSTRGGQLDAPAPLKPSGLVWQDENGVHHPVSVALGGVLVPVQWLGLGAARTVTVYAPDGGYIMAVIQQVFASGTTASNIFALRT